MWFRTQGRGELWGFGKQHLKKNLRFENSNFFSRKCSNIVAEKQDKENMGKVKKIRENRWHWDL